ncbi:MAG TPA: hypothetical protein VGB77_02630 [Abditibacteriaceae bacterium]|jgi:hypothetical protein
MLRYITFGFVIFLFFAAHLRAQKVEGPEEVGKEFVAYLARRDLESLKLIITRDSLDRLGENGVRDVVNELRLVPSRWESKSDGATAQVTPIFEPQLVLCRRQGRFWRVDLIATGAKWLKFSGSEAAFVRKYSHQPLLSEESRVICASNLKALAVALRQYAEDYDDHYPPANVWTDALRPYLSNRQVFHCPAAGKNRYGYALNRRLSKQPPPKSTMNPQNNNFVVLYETTQLKSNAHRDGSDLAFRHEGKTQVLEADDAVRSFNNGKSLKFHLPLLP